MSQGSLEKPLKRMMNSQPKAIDKIGDEEFKITWDDGHQSVFPVQLLRRNCPCALCKDEFTGEKKLDPADIPDSITAGRAELVGQYAISFGFSDGHGTGIFSFGYLRGLCPCEECVPLKQGEDSVSENGASHG